MYLVALVSLAWTVVLSLIRGEYDNGIETETTMTICDINDESD